MQTKNSKFLLLILAVFTVKLAAGQDETTTQATVLTSPAASKTTNLFQIITFQRTTKWQYITFEPPGDDYLEGINPWITRITTTTTTSPRPTGTTYPPAPDVFQSDFDFDLGGFLYDQKSTFNWTRWTMTCPHVGTGPQTGDHTTGMGYYMYIDCSEPRLSGMVARLITPELQTSTGCANITFWYNAFGYHLGRFTVKVSEAPYQKEKTVYELSGDAQATEDRWKFAAAIGPGVRYKVIFEGVVGKGYQGDYAFDDVLITQTTCPLTTPDPSATDPNARPFYLQDITTPSPGGLQGWAIALIVVAIVAVIVAVLLALYLVYRQKRLRLQRELEEKEEEERRKREMDDEGVIHTDRPYSNSRVRSGVPQDRPQGRMLASAQRRMAPGYGARPGSRTGSNYGRLDLPASAISKRGHSPNSALGLHNKDSSEYGYDQEGDVSIGQGGDANYSRDLSSARLRSAARVRSDVADQAMTLEESNVVAHHPSRLPPIFGGETPPSSAAASGRTPLAAPPSSDLMTITDVSPMPIRREINEPASLRPETPKTQTNGKDEKMGWFD